MRCVERCDCGLLMETSTQVYIYKHILGFNAFRLLFSNHYTAFCNLKITCKSHILLIIHANCGHNCRLKKHIPFHVEIIINHTHNFHTYGVFTPYVWCMRVDDGIYERWRADLYDTIYNDGGISLLGSVSLFKFNYSTCRKIRLIKNFDARAPAMSLRLCRTWLKITKKFEK